MARAGRVYRLVELVRRCAQKGSSPLPLGLPEARPTGDYAPDGPTADNPCMARHGGRGCSRRRLAPGCRGRLNKGRCALSGWNAPWRAQPHPPKPQPPLAARLIPANRPPGDCAPDGPTAVALRLPALRFGPPGGVYRALCAGVAFVMVSLVGCQFVH